MEFYYLGTSICWLEKNLGSLNEEIMCSLPCRKADKILCYMIKLLCKYDFLKSSPVRYLGL